MKHSVILNKHIERLAEALKKSNSGYARQQLREIERMASTVSALERLAVARNPKETEEAHAVKVAKAAQRIGADIEKINDRIHNIVREGVVSLESEIRNKAGLIPNQYASEIRQSFRMMDEKQRFEALNQALKVGDAETIAAIADAPQIVTGIKNDFRESIVESLQKQKAPELYSQLDENYNAFSTAVAALGTVRKAVDDGFNPVKLREIEEAEAKHLEASSQFESSFNQNEFNG